VKLRLRSSVVLGALAIFLPATARADAGEADALERQLEQEHAALSTADCNTACKALGSIQRAAEKICAIEPGPRCSSARAKADDAARRVREACPDCVIAEGPSKEAPRAAQPVAASDAVATRERAESRGGCRSCGTSGSSDSRGDVGVIVFGVAAAVRLLGRSKKERRKV
jgi:hypothetical protein